MSFAKANLIGRLTKDVSIKQPNPEVTVGSFSIAVNRKSKQGDATDYFDVVCFNKQAEVVERIFKKGSLIHVDATPQLNQWKDKEGNFKSKIQFVLNNFTILESNKNNTSDFPKNKPETKEMFAGDDIPF